MYGFIYKFDDEYAIRIGDALHFLFDDISDIDEEVEIGNIDDSKRLDGYCLSINKLRKEWSIKDTGHKNCKDILAKGRYKDGFEKSMVPILKIFK